MINDHLCHPPMPHKSQSFQFFPHLNPHAVVHVECESRLAPCDIMLGQRGSLKSLAVITHPKNSIWFHKIVSGRHYGDKYKGKFYNY